MILGQTNLINPAFVTDMKMFDDASAYLLELLTLVASSPGRVFALVTVKTNNFKFVNKLLFSSCPMMKFRHK